MLVLAVWLTYQGRLIGFAAPMQYMTAGNGMLILLFALLPGVRRYTA